MSTTDHSPVSLLESGQMPAHMLPSPRAFEQCGFVLSIPRLGEPFVSAVLPVGWRYASAPGALTWAIVRDALGRERAWVFTGRPADGISPEPLSHAILLSRFGVRPMLSPTGRAIGATVVDRGRLEQDGAVLMVWSIQGNGHLDPAYQQSHRKAFAEANRWLSDHYVNHRDPLAYWDMI